MKMSINPLTSRKVDNKRRLVFNEQTMSYVSLAKGKYTKLQKGERLQYDPLGCKFIVVRKKRLFEK